MRSPWGWLCGQRDSVKYNLMLEKSIGLGITDEVRRHAVWICDLQREEMVLEFQLSKLVSEPQFLPYRKVFARFGFGRRVEALLLSQTRVAAKAVKLLFRELVRELVHKP